MNSPGSSLRLLMCCGTGDANDCEQTITLNFDFGASGITALERISRDDGTISDVTLTSDGGTTYHLDLTLDGGEGDLFKFKNGGVFVGVL